MIDSGAGSDLESEVHSRCDCGCGDLVGIAAQLTSMLAMQSLPTRTCHSRVPALVRGVSSWALLRELIKVPCEYSDCVIERCFAAFHYHTLSSMSLDFD